MGKIKLVFLDADDTFLTPPYDAIRRVSRLMGAKYFPSEQAFIERSRLEYFEAFPKEFKSKGRMWLRAFIALPFGFFRSYKLFPEVSASELSSLLGDERVTVLSKNPPLFAKARVQRIYELTGVFLGGRYRACGPIWGRATPKIDIIGRIAKAKGIDLSDCLIVDDALENVAEAAAAGVKGLLIDAPWNRTLDEDACLGPHVSRVRREHFVSIVQELLDEPEAALRQSETVYVIPSESHRSYVASTGQRASVISLQSRSFGKILRKGPHNESIDAFIALVKRSDYLSLEITLRDEHGFLRTLTAQEKVSFVPAVPELALASGIKLRSFCRDQFEARGHPFELPAFFNLYYRSREQIIGEIKADPTVKDAMITFMKTERFSQTEATEILHRHINSVVFTRSYRSCVAGYTALDFIMKKILRSVSIRFPQGLDKIEAESFTIYAPIHRSYLDSGILGVELARARKQYPYTVAADKMLKVWLGRIGSHIGVFFVARQKIDGIYSAVVMSYLRQIQREGGCIDIFIEGARSRSGLTLPPKRGIISSIEANRKLLGLQKVAIVPVAFAYNKLPESEVLLDEVYEERRKEGKASLKEQADFLVKTRERKTFFQKIHSLNRRLWAAKVSDCSIECGDPVLLGDATSLSHWTKAPEALAGPTVQDTLNEVMYRINQITPVLPSSVIALALLASRDHHITFERLDQFLRLSHRLISLYRLPRDVLYDLELTEEHIADAMNLPFINRRFKQAGIDERWIVSLTELDSTRAVHYKNNILHYLVLPATLANILAFSTKPVKIEELHRYLDHLFQELSIKYFLPITGKIDRLINNITEVFLEFGFISRHADSYLFSGESERAGPFLILSALAEDFARNDLMPAFARFRRAFQRLEIEISATLRHGSNDHIVIIRNLSAGGALLVFESSQVRQGDEIRLSISHEGHRFEFKGRVIRLEEFGAGVQFIDVSDTAHNILLMIINSFAGQYAREREPAA
jgi:hypothetical protein